MWHLLKQMKYEKKLKETDQSAEEVIGRMGHAQKQADARVLLDVFTSVTGLPPKVWGEKQIGFGKVHYRYPTGHEGDMYLAGFAVTEKRITLYLHLEGAMQQASLERLGKVTTGKVCVYVNKLADIDLEVLKPMIAETVRFTLETFPVSKEMEP